jgi:signal transduction histidine kinase
MNYDFKRPTSEMVDGPVWTGNDDFKVWFCRPDEAQLERERSLRVEEQGRERARIARELHDTLLQGFLGASLVLHDAVEQMPADSPSKLSLGRALQLMYRVIDEGRVALQGLRSPRVSFANLEKALSEIADEFTSDHSVRFRTLVMGKPKALKPEIEEQVCLIAREALVNAFRHSEATNIEAEVEYLPSKVRVVVRDNGCGVDPEVLRFGRDSHWGLVGMRERAHCIGARLRMWSRPGIGTEVEISVPADQAMDARDYVPESPALQESAVA